MSGILFPKTDKGDRSTTSLNKIVVKELANGLGRSDLATAAMAEKDWRHKYDAHLNSVIEALISTGAKNPGSMTSALKAGLEAARSMDFESEEGVVPLAQAIKNVKTPFQTYQVKGSGAPKLDLKLPYAGKELTGAELDSQCDRWVTSGCMEPDCGSAIKVGSKRVAELSGRTFLILGAGSELGPLRPLLEAGATVAAVATKKPKRWSELISFARSTAGTLLIPGRGNAQTDEEIASAAGADLLVDTPAVIEWIVRRGREAPGLVTLGTYLYADGEANVRLTAASDFAVEVVAQALGTSKVSFAWLASCSTTLICSQEAVAAQKQKMADATWWQKLVGTAQECATVEGSAGPINVFHGFEVLQGPNYALAQSMRQWRAILLHQQGFVVSSPVTPMCRTESVCHNSTMATILDGVCHIAPLEAYQPEACRMAMFAILISDLCEPVPKLASPFHLLARKAFHSGLFRCPFVMSSMGKTVWFLGKIAPRQSP